MMPYSLSAIIQLLNPDNTISAHRMLAHAIGMNETIIYSALISKQTYYSQNGKLLEGGWFFSTVCDLQESTTFGEKAQKTAVKHLMEHGLIECEYKGLPTRRHFRIIDDTEILMKLIDKGTEISRKIVSKSRERISEKSHRRSGKNPANIQKEVREQSTKSNAENSTPAAVPCSRPSAGTSSRQPQDKSKDNINPKKFNREINQSINQSKRSEDRRRVENVEKAERQNYKSIKFSEVLKNIGVDWYRLRPFEPKSEKDFDGLDEVVRKTQKCKIPYSLKNDKRNMKAALRYLCGYSYYFGEGKDEERRVLWETIICSLAEMTEGDSINVSGRKVMYYEIIDQLNEIISKSYLADCFVGFEEEWKKIISEKEITHYKAYLKSCLWNWLCDFEFEEYNDANRSV